MKIFLLKKSLSDLKNPVVRTERDTAAMTVREFITETVERNYALRPVEDPLQECVKLALDEFEASGFYIVNVTRDIKYRALDEYTEFSDGDEVMIIKLKYLRGFIW